MGDLSLSLFIFFDAARVHTLCLSLGGCWRKKRHVDVHTLILSPARFFFVGKLQCAKKERKKSIHQKSQMLKYFGISTVFRLLCVVAQANRELFQEVSSLLFSSPPHTIVIINFNSLLSLAKMPFVLLTPHCVCCDPADDEDDDTARKSAGEPAHIFAKQKKSWKSS